MFYIFVLIERLKGEAEASQKALDKAGDQNTNLKATGAAPQGPGAQGRGGGEGGARVSEPWSGQLETERKRCEAALAESYHLILVIWWAPHEI